MKKSLIKIIKFIGVGIVILYPFAVFFALKKRIALRFFALLLLVLAGISFVRNKNIWFFICVLLLGLGLAVYNNDIFLKLYPVLMNISMCLMFALSLRTKPLMEKFAAKMGYVLNEKQKEYAKFMTCVWAIFMFCIAVISFGTVFLSDSIWVLFNGLISYVLIGMMMLIEFVVRKKVIDVRKDK